MDDPHQRIRAAVTAFARGELVVVADDDDRENDATGTVVEVDHPTRGTYLTVGNPIKLSDSIADVRRSPLLGEHTDEVLREVLRYSAKEIGEIKASGAISAPDKKAEAA
jgi:formyl-CoA transferase